MTKELKALLKMAKTVKMTAAQRDIQRQSFAYGNARIENRLVTRRMVAEEAAKLKKSKHG